MSITSYHSSPAPALKFVFTKSPVLKIFTRKNIYYVLVVTSFIAIFKIVSQSVCVHCHVCMYTYL